MYGHHVAQRTRGSGDGAVCDAPAICWAMSNTKQTDVFGPTERPCPFCHPQSWGEAAPCSHGHHL